MGRGFRWRAPNSLTLTICGSRGRCDQPSSNRFHSAPIANKATLAFRVRPMDENPCLPNYDPAFCLKVAKLGAVACLASLIIEVCILAFVDPATSRCPRWIIHGENGQTTPLWLLVGMFTAAPTAWSCFVVLRWKRFSRIFYDDAAGTYTPFPWPKELYRRYKPDPLTFPYNQMFVEVTLGWSLFCTAPLWIMLASCTNLPRYLGC